MKMREERDIEFDHVSFLKGAGYDFSCSECGYMDRKEPVKCDYCGSKKFLSTREVLKKLELCV